MDTIHLPSSPAYRAAGWLAILGAAGLVLLCPLSVPLRLAGAALVLLYGAWLWGRHLRAWPSTLAVGADGRLRCRCADGASLQVSQVRLGVLRPWLISARLYLDTGRRIDLFVPGGLLSAAAHWRLRRALAGFRPPPIDPSQAADSVV